MSWMWWDGKSDARALANEGKEVWACVEEDPDYAVSNLGRVSSRKHGTAKILSGALLESGRATVTLSGKGTRLIYQLVVQTFDGEPPTPEHTDVRHLNCDRTDNRLSNLCWGTRSENMKDTADYRRSGGVRKEVDVDAARTRHWYAGLTADTELVEACIDMYHQKKLEVSEITRLLRCSRDTFTNILRGASQKDIPRPEGFDDVNRRKGENHRSTKFTDAQIREALSLYVQNHWSCRQFAEHLGMKPITADAVLVGRNWAHIPRPEGFQYPWPDARTMNKRVGADHGCSKVSEEKVRETFQKIMEGELTSMRAVAMHLGLAKGPAYSIVRGDSWSHVPRPEGFSEAVAKIQRKIMSSEEQQAIIADFVAGVPRGEIQKKYELPHDKLHYYAKKAQRIQQESTAG